MILDDGAKETSYMGKKLKNKTRCAEAHSLKLLISTCLDMIVTANCILEFSLPSLMASDLLLCLLPSLTLHFIMESKKILELWRKARNNLHGRLMKTNYEAVPNWWFYIILCVVFLLSCELAKGSANSFNSHGGQIGLNIITEMVIGYIYPGRPLANVSFKTYGYISMSQALSFLSDFKLGHYMKIPPKSMFIAQLVGTMVASSVYFGTAWWGLDTDDHCPLATCPTDPGVVVKGCPVMH
ncbi:hypothetical protein CASFOL_040482 [Castilleja foliolosa]|uniref:Uncharacterized protein n=1 Tax=Castilleja foliolosa TaxID=1961234 RepID=A0ABD3BCM3_9LAMI